MTSLGITKCGNKEFRWGERTYIMGILNVSPDSFSGDGIADIQTVVERARRLEADGADIIDIGGETTRPGSTPITTEEEMDRVLPVIERVVKAVSVPLSIDSSKFEVVARIVQAGASMINDEWGLKRDSRLAQLAGEKNIPLVLMSNQREKGGYDPQHKSDTSHYEDVMTEVKISLHESLDIALKTGVPRENIILDPGIGFGKNWEQNLQIIRHLSELKSLGRPILIGPSRKAFIGRILDLPPEDRLEGTAATVAISITNGADIIRVHDVKTMVRVARMSDAIIRA